MTLPIHPASWLGSSSGGKSARGWWARPAWTQRLMVLTRESIDVSAGQTSTDARPIYGRMFQTPFSDRIRNETGIATMAVGNIYEPDHVNSILMAGRADLVCLARPHLADPYWTLHAAIEMGDSETEWPLPYLNGRDQARRLRERAQETIRV